LSFYKKFGLHLVTKELRIPSFRIFRGDSALLSGGKDGQAVGAEDFLEILGFSL
jgi:hypothetical protein